MWKNVFLLEDDSGPFLRPSTRTPNKLNREKIYIPLSRLRLQTSCRKAHKQLQIVGNTTVCFSTRFHIDEPNASPVKVVV